MKSDDCNRCHNESIHGETYRAMHASSAHRTATMIEGRPAQGPNG
jgi:hypothetical protein